MNLQDSTSRKKQFKEAIPLLLRIVELGGENALVHQQLGFAYYRLDQLTASVEAYKQAVKLDLESAQTSDSLSHILLRLERYDEALEACQRLVHLKPDDTTAYRQLSGYRLR
ncbi:MAG: tetratricopeptide repeat protein [Acidobacteria bacterium]|nr:tetratricopeptide repeat protein [Acidobacteriota bacterium]